MLRRPHCSTLFPYTTLFRSLLYRALTGHSPRPDENGEVPKPSAVVADGAPQIPADLDLLCELVLNETSEEIRSEEHTSELQSRGHLVCRLLLAKKTRNMVIMTSFKPPGRPATPRSHQTLG